MSVYTEILYFIHASLFASPTPENKDFSRVFFCLKTQMSDQRKDLFNRQETLHWNVKEGVITVYSISN